MKENIHPKYKEIKVTCSCGNEFVTASTIENDKLHLEICSACHPFYTGKQKVVDTAGRVDRFKQKYSKKTVAIAKPASAETIKPAKKTAQRKTAVKKKNEKS
ncbi:MAG: 50S ribosomal protein L31 [Gammaproteobacteria bacterium]